jgi:hypothetical protein
MTQQPKAMTTIKNAQEGLSLPRHSTSIVKVEWAMALPSCANLREHWAKRAKRVKTQRHATRLMLGTSTYATSFGRKPTGGQPLAVRLTRVSPRPLDDDNLQMAFKAIRDEVAAYFGVDDRDPRIRFVYAQAKGKASVRIEFAVEDDMRSRVESNAKRVHEAAEATLAAFSGLL